MSSFVAEILHAEDSDIQWVIQNIETCTVEPFEAINVKQLFEITPWSLIAKQQQEIKAFAAFMDYPFQDHYSNEWHGNVKQTWTSSRYYRSNVFFLHVLVCKSDVKLFLEKLLEATFLSITSLEFCCILLRDTDHLHADIKSLFERDISVESNGFEFWATRRGLFVPKVGIRKKRSEDYLELRNLFSQMYGPFKESALRTFTLDFLDYGEDRKATYKYFTYDDDNTCIGIAENELGRAVGLIFATIQRVDLESLNRHFQLESVYGLRKKHPDDNREMAFTGDSTSASEGSCDEEDEVRELVAKLVDEIVTDFEVVACMKDVVDEVCEVPKRHYKKRRDDFDVTSVSCPTFLNSRDFDLKNPSHLSLVTDKNLHYFATETLLRLVNSDNFDPENNIHMKLLPPLGRSIQKLEQEKLKRILSSELFDPAIEKFAMLIIHVMSYMPESKLHRFQKSTIGHQIYEKLMYRMAEEKKVATLKAKKNKPAPKLSFKDTQIILHHTKNLKRKDDRAKKGDIPSETQMDGWKHVSYRNMGFISGLTTRNQYRVQKSCSFSKLKSPFGCESRDELDAQANEVYNSDRYPVWDGEKNARLVQEIPVYNGGTNCFYIEQFAIEQRYESQSLRLIQAAFSYFPRVDYCISLLPHGTRQVPYLRQYFSNIPSRPFASYGKELYVLHKASINSSHEIRLYDNDNDYKGVQKLVSCSCLKEYLLKDLEDSSSNKIKSVVLISEEKVFGIAVIKDLKEVETIRRKYDVTERINMKYHKYTNQGMLLHCVVHPSFKYLAKVFLKETMRLTGKSILYYKIYPSHLVPYDPSAWQSLCNVLEEMSPLKPSTRPSKSYIVLRNKDDNATPNKNEIDADVSTSDEKRYHCLSYTCTKIVMKDKNINSARIIVVGDSDVSLGVLESLVYSERFKFINLTVVSKWGIKCEYHLDSKCYYCLPISMDYTEAKLDGICLPTWVTVVRGEVISIKRNRLVLQEISPDKPDHFVYDYDYLVLCSNLEFQTLRVKKISKGGESEPSKKRQYPLLKKLDEERITLEKPPSNVFSVNNAQEAASVLNWLWRYFSNKVESRKQPKRKYKKLTEMERDKHDRIVLYGNCLEAYSTLAVLIAEDFPLCRITFIKSVGNTSPFCTNCVEEAILSVISKTNVDVIIDASIEYDDSAEVLSLDVTTSAGTTRLECCALLLFEERKINFHMFQTLHKSPLSFTLPTTKIKGHPYLLMNTNFQTNVKNVFAAGSMTAMYTDREIIRFEDCVYNEREVGMAVGRNVNNLVADTLQHSSLLPNLSCPVVTYVKLPGEYFYFFITSPTSRFKKISDSKNIENRVLRLVLGNLNTRTDILPSSSTESDGKLDDNLNQEETSMLLDSKLNSDDILKATNNLDDSTRESDNLSTSIDINADKEANNVISDTESRNPELRDEREQEPLKKEIPDEPEYFALSFDKDESISTIEGFTLKDVDVDALKNLYEVHISQLYKIIQKVGDKSSSKLSFRLTENWTLLLDYVMFEDGSHGGRNFGYEGYWRQDYPTHIEARLNSFLDSFVDRKSRK